METQAKQVGRLSSNGRLITKQINEFRQSPQIMQTKRHKPNSKHKETLEKWWQRKEPPNQRWAHGHKWELSEVFQSLQNYKFFYVFSSNNFGRQCSFSKWLVECGVNCQQMKQRKARKPQTVHTFVLCTVSVIVLMSQKHVTTLLQQYFDRSSGEKKPSAQTQETTNHRGYLLKTRNHTHQVTTKSQNCDSDLQLIPITGWKLRD